MTLARPTTPSRTSRTISRVRHGKDGSYKPLTARYKPCIRSNTCLDNRRFAGRSRYTRIRRRNSATYWIERQRGGSGADLGLWWLARVEGRPAAALIGRAWPETGWVQALGTLREFRGHGLGRLLLMTSFAEFGRRGYERVALSVDAANPTGAVALYESAGMKVSYEAVRYVFEALPRTAVSSVAE